MKPTIPPRTVYLYPYVKNWKVFFVTLYLFLISITSSYAQTFFGVSSTPADGGAQPGPTAILVPPALMQAGDLVIIYGQYAASSAALSISVTGGQTWNSGTVYTTGGANQSIFISWCRFNGTWTLNPVVSGPGVLGLTAIMYVYRPSSPSSLWGVNVVQLNANTATAAQTIASATTTLPRTVTMGFVANRSTNTWALTPAAGWVNANLTNQNINTVTGQTQAAVYNIRATAGATGTVTLTQTSAVSTLRSRMSWYEYNDDCSSAISLTPGGSCTNTPGTMVGATISSGVPVGCATAANLYDVWYSFTATSQNHTISLSSLQANFNNKQIIVYKGACGGLSVVTCSAVSGGTGNFNYNFTDYSVGTTYYVRVIYPTAGAAISTNGGFNICVTTTAVAAAKIQTGKSYTNITRPNGGVVQIGDVLEFRNVIAVGDWSATGSIYNTTFHDTIPAGLSYIANSIRFSTNEGMTYESGITGLTNLTDASGDDEAVYNGGVIRVNVGSLNKDAGAAAANRQFVYECSPAVTPITYASAGGGKISPRGRPSQFGSFCLIVVRYQATVTAATGTIFTTSNGEFRYKTTSNPDDIGVPQTIASFPRYSVYVSDENTLCQTSVGINAYSNGDFGSGTTRHDSTQLLLAPDYLWSPFATGNPGDGLFSVVNNTSADLSTNKYVGIPDAVRRVFGVWDIIGDHTGAADVDSGNFAVPYGTNGGYMAVVNAAYGINTAVQRNITGLCGDTYYEFSAWFKNICAACSSDSTGRTPTGSGAALFKSYLGSKTLNDSAGVSPDVTYTIDGVDYYTSGSIEYDRRWVKKGFLFKTGPAQTSVNLTIRNNAPGGGGNDWAFDDVGLATCLPSLAMRPSNTPTYCTNGQIDMSVIVNTFYNNYGLYQWERSTDGGGSWHAAPELPGVQSYTYTFDGTSYLDTVAYPPIIATAITNGYMYRIKTATSLANLSSSSCSVYNTVDVITITVDGGCVVLPVELLQFNAQLKNGYTELKWQSKQEQDLQKYDVERSADGKNFVKIGTVTAKGGNDAQNYTFTDSNPVTGKVYYRLQLVSAQNKKYSNILSVTGDLSNRFELTNLVNPFNAKISFQITVPQNEVIEVNLLDAAGKIIYQTKMNVNKGINAMNFETPSAIQKGNYLLRVVSKEGVVNKLIQKH
ncbi:MAG: T9SS type A sorting domain-containing protein [Lacibacter sp.]